MEPKKAPINTSDASPEILFDAMAIGSSSAIELQEARGQISLVGSDTLPLKISDEDKAILEQVGIRFLGPVSGDPLFQYVELPAGWKKERTDHPLWSKLLDDKGRERASIFYKAAFYDRDAFMHLKCRYGYGTDYGRGDSEHVAVASVTLDDIRIFSTDPIPLPEDEADWKGRHEATERANRMAVAWLDEHFPQWRSPAAYW